MSRSISERNTKRMKYDLTFPIVQSLTVTGIGLFPIVIVALLLSTSIRTAMAFALPYLVVAASISIIIFMECDGRMNSFLGKQIGPSLLSIRMAILPILAWTIWFPTVIAGVFLVRLKKFPACDFSRIFSRIKLDAMIVMAVLIPGAWIAFLLKMGEFTHEDTLWATDFTLERWRKVEQGMSRNAVYELIGQPLGRDANERFRFGQGLSSNGITPEMWAANYSAGWNAAIYFNDDDLVKELQLNFSD